MQGLKVGHQTNHEHGTGVSVFIFDEPAVGAYYLCGSGPASHELAPLDPEVSVGELHGLVLSGGSAFGLFCAKGAMQFFAERNKGLKLPHGVVPIVPAAAIYDLAYKEDEVPTDEDAYQACLNAVANNTQSGRIGAGTGATIGKLIPGTQMMSGGIGYAELSLTNGVQVVAYAVVNAAGDVRDEQDNIIAGARNKEGSFADTNAYLLSGESEEEFFSPSNTTLVAVFTNAKFSKGELKRISKMAIAGMARSISPIFSCFDGDILFSISLGSKTCSVLTVGAMAAEAVRLAIIDAVKDSVVV